MNITLGIGGVDGETIFEIQCKDATSALRFMKHYDHEGSGIGMKVIFDDAEEIYYFLQYRAGQESRKKDNQ